MRIPLPWRQERGTLQHRPPTAPGLEGSTATSIPPFHPQLQGAFPQERGLRHAHTVLRAEAHRAPCASIAVPIYSMHQRGCIKLCKGSGPSCSACLQQQGLSLQLRAHRVPQLILGLQDGKGAQPRICSLQWGRECCRCTVPHRSAAVKPTAGLCCHPRVLLSCLHQRGRRASPQSINMLPVPGEVQHQSAQCTRPPGGGNRGTAASWSLGTARLFQPTQERSSPLPPGPRPLYSCFIPVPLGAQAERREGSLFPEELSIS